MAVPSLRGVADVRIGHPHATEANSSRDSHRSGSQRKRLTEMEAWVGIEQAYAALQAAA